MNNGGKPILKGVDWNWQVNTYLLLGGLMGGSAILAALADSRRSEGEAKVQRRASLTAFVLSVVAPAILTTHLGRPERFLHMLRIVKFKSPMSMGVWGLVAFSSLSSLNFITKSRALTWLNAVQGAFISGYTGVLLSATAVPLWAKSKFHLPALFVSSSVAGACALNGLIAHTESSDASRKVELLEMAAASCELILLAHLQRYSGEYGKPLFMGARGERLRDATINAGLLTPLVVGTASLLLPLPRPLRRSLRMLSSVMTLRGSYVLRESFIEAGKASSADRNAGLNQPA